MNILVDAVDAFNNKDYEKAIHLFEKAGEIYGIELVDYHLTRCKTLIKTQSSGITEERVPTHFEDEKNQVSPLDLATEIMLISTKNDKSYAIQKNELVNQWKSITEKKSQNAEIRKEVPSIPKDWPEDLVLSPLPEGVNDFLWWRKRKQAKVVGRKEVVGLSVIVPTFDRSWILDITLACLVKQETVYSYEVIVADDGSKEDIVAITRKYESLLDIKYVRQKDYGYQLCAVRNLGLRTSKYDFVAILDCDMAPNPKWVQSYVEALLEDDDVALIGPRKYVDTHGMAANQFLDKQGLIETLPEIRTINKTAGKDEGNVSVDWRLEHFKKTDNLRLCDTPFRFFSGGNVAFAKKWLNKAGWFDEEFTHWGGEDNEFAYRLFREGCFFRALEGGMAYHQEPPGKENETDREQGKLQTALLVQEKVPYHYRKLLDISEAKMFKVPLVSIYVPAYNCEKTIKRCVDSALNQTVTDLQVCICDDGSTDGTLSLIQKLYGTNPRVKIISKENGGIASASNAAVMAADGFYIGQLDSDDYLEPDAVELCLKEFLRDKSLACVYTANRNVNPDGSLIELGYNWPEFSRENFATKMIVHHFRMFSMRAWKLTVGFDECLENAVDYDIYLKLSEVGPFKHINKVAYNRVLHGDNTSIKRQGVQKQNHFKVVNAFFKRQGIHSYQYVASDDDPSSRKYRFVPCNIEKGVLPETGKRGEQLFSTEEKMANKSTSGGLVFSIVCPAFPEGLLKKLENIVLYNSCEAVVVCIDKKYVTERLRNEVEKFGQKNQVIVRINPQEYPKDARFRYCELYLSNFEILKKLECNAEYLVFEAYSSMYVLSDSLVYMRKYDIGMNFGRVDGYWQKAISSHQTLLNFMQERNLGELNALNIKGVIGGTFVRLELAVRLFDIVSDLVKLCHEHKDYAKYPTEEIWFQLAVKYLENQLGASFKKTASLTHFPWERQLSWTVEQIEKAKQGIGIGKNKYSIGNVIYKD